MLKLVLIEKLPSGIANEIQLPLTGVHAIVAKPDASYSVFDQATMLPPAGLVLKRKQDELEIELDQQLVVSIENFFVTPTGADSTAQFSIDGSSSEAMIVTAETASTLGEENIVWQLAEEPGSSFTALSVAGITVGAAAAGTGAGSAAAAVAASSYNMTISAAAGVLQSQVTVKIYDKDGNLLATQEHNFSSGALVFKIKNGYQGPILAKVENSNGATGDYINEASNQLVDLGTDLRAMASANGADDVAINITPLTELAVRKAGITGNTLTATNLATNQKIANLFGIDDILGPAVTVLDTQYDASNGLSAAEKYGNLLAALAGSDNKTGGQKQTLDQLETRIVDNSSTLALTQEGVKLIKEGLDYFEGGVNSAKADLQHSLLMAPFIEQANDGLTLAEANAGVLVQVAGAKIGDTVTLHWGHQVITHNVLNLNAQDSVEISVASNIVSAYQGEVAVSAQINAGKQSPAVIISVDSEAPKVAIIMADNALKSGETSLVTFTFDETPTGFTQGDITVENGSLSSFTVTADDKVYTATFTPTVNIEDTSNIISVGTGYTDAAGNAGTANTSANYTIDTTAPTVVITMADTALNIGETSLVTFTFDEADDKVYTATFTPTFNIEDTSNIVSVGTGYTDAAGNTGTVNTSANYAIDTTAPTVAITMADTALKIGETSLVTFTFDEAPTSFTQEDVTVENGSLSAFIVTADDKVFTAMFTPTVNIEDSTNLISVSSGYTDAAGNAGTANTSANYTIDTTVPTVVITMADTALNIGETSLVTFTFNEAPTGFTQADVTVEKGSVSGFTVTADDKVYTATFTPTVNVEDSTNLISVSTGYTDAAGNVGTANTSANYTIDTTAPTVAITMTDTALIIGETSLVTFTFDETPTGFTQEDVAVENGSLSGFTVTADDKVYTATFTPTVNIEDTSNIVSVGTGYTDAAGNAGTANTSANYTIDTIDTTAPTVAITMVDTTLIIGDTSLVTFTFSETPTDFTQADINVDNGSLSAFSVTADDKIYTATFTPDTNIEESTNLISVSTDYTDAAGNDGVANNSANYSVDTKAPTVTISLADSALKIGETSEVTFTFSEAPIGFIATDISADNGSISGLAVSSTDNKVYTATFTPNTDIEDSTNLISVSSDYTDAAGNIGLVSNSANYSVDTKVPTVTISLSKSTLKIGQTSEITFTFSEVPIGFIAADISADNGSISALTVSSADNKVYTATFTPDTNIQDNTNSISVTNAYTDAAGNTGTVANSTYFSIDTFAPTLISSKPVDEAGNILVSDNLVLAFSENIQLGSSGNIVLKANGATDIIIAVASHSNQLSTKGTTLTINPNADLQADTQYSIQIDNGAVIDAADNNYSGITDETTLNFTTAAAADPSIVVFDLTDGQSSSHSGREFQANVDYSIYIKVNSVFNSANRISIVDSLGNNNKWSGGANLSSNDKIILVGTGETIVGPHGNPLNYTKAYTSGGSGLWHWQTGGSANNTILGLNSSTPNPGQAYSNRAGTGSTKTNIWTGNWSVTLSFNIATALPANVATSQGV